MEKDEDNVVGTDFYSSGLAQAGTSVVPLGSQQLDQDIEAQQDVDPPRSSASSTKTARTWTEDPEKLHTPSVEKLDEFQIGVEAADGTLHAQTLLHHVTSEGGEEEDAILALPPPPSYDVFVRNLSIAVPPFRAYIPTPIPIPIPQAVTDTFSRWSAQSKKTSPNNTPTESPDVATATDGLIVRNVNATVKRGEVMAIIGGSGSGKTTVLHAIAARLNNLPIAEGHVEIRPSHAGGAGSDAHPKGGEGHFKGMSKVVGFVRQHDYLLPFLTVRETLTYAAKLRLPASVDRETRKLIVEQTIQELGLAEAADTIVGGAGRKGISGGEKRRLSIGCVLVSYPSVLILDEVTTGLDSFTAYQLLQTLSRLAARGRTIILSLHQPRSDAFPLFTRLLLLSHGSVVYSGLTRYCLPYFSQLGYAPEEQTNPLDFLVDVAGVDVRDEESERESRERVRRLVQCWKEKEGTHMELETAKGQLTEPESKKETWKTQDASSSVEIINSIMSDARPNIFKQTLILLPRSTKNMLRGYPELVGHFCQAVFLGLFMGITFFQLSASETVADIQSLKTLAFQVVPVYAYMSQVVWTFKWCSSLVVFDREREDGLYKPAAWVLAEGAAWAPVNIICPAIYGTMIYFISGMRRDAGWGTPFGVFVIDMVMIQMCFIAWSLFVASIERSFARASLLGNALSIFFILSPGFFIVNVPGWIRWFRWISPHFYSFRIAVLSQFRDRIFACASSGGPEATQCIGENVLRGLRISPTQPLWPMFLGNLGFIIVISLLAWVLLSLWKPGGVRHARRIQSAHKGKELFLPEIDLVRSPITVHASSLTLKHVHRSLRTLDKKEKQILNGVSATFPSGEVSVIMGPSGSGKSTFLRMISGRGAGRAGLGGSFQSGGEVCFGDNKVGRKEMRRVCAFVEQDDDYHLPALTVRETLRFAALIKLPSHISRKRKIARAEEVLRMLGLRECADGMVGGELMKGISGGEKRRLSLACEMINDPAVLIVDEPTSGLDANTAQNVMEALRDIARSGRTVIASLHQPRSDIYNMADNLMILAKGGNVVYQGPRTQLLPHLAFTGYVCPPLYNPSDYVMDLVSVDVRGKTRQEKTQARIQELTDLWRGHQKKMDEVKEDSNGLKEHKKDSNGKVVTAEKYSGGPQEMATIEETPLWVALPVVLERTWKNTWRQPDLFWTRFIQAPILAVCFFIFFLRLPHGPTGAQNRIGLVAECTSSLTFVGFLNLAALYPPEKTIFFHDYKSAGGRYSTITFILAFSIFAIIPEFLSAIIFTVIMHVATGMRTNATFFFEFAVSVWVQLSFGESIGIAFASFFDTMGLSVSLVSVFLTIASQCSGVFSASIAQFLADIAWIFPMKYGARIMLINELKGMVFDCSEESIMNGECSAATGDQVLDLFGFHDAPWKLLLISIAVTVGYRVAAWGVLATKMRYV